MSKNYIVRNGDSISSIAFRHGFSPNTLWNHPQNAEMRQQRKVGSVLKTGDVIFIPDRHRKTVSKPTESEHVFRLKGVPEKISVRFLDHNNEPRSGCRYSIIIGSDLRKGKTDADGYVNAFIPPDTQKAKILIFDKDFTDEYEIMIGHLSPLTELAGIRSRLSNLGYPCGDEDILTGKTLDSLLRFQKDYKLPETGELDDRTRRRIEEIYGS